MRLSADPRAGWAALAFTIAVWASYLVAARAAVTTSFTPVELGLMRFLPGAVLFVPLLWRRGLRPGGARWRDVGLIAGFGGVLFVLLLTSGLRFAPVADSVIFTPAMLPVFVAGLARLIDGDRITGRRLAGLGLILAGAMAVGGWEALGRGGGAWRGHLLFLGASFSWAVYTLAYRRSGLGATDSAAIMCFWTSLAFLPLALITGVDFLRGGWGPLALHGTLQGLFSGFLATLSFFVAITRLGPGTVAPFAALVPGLAALGAWAILDEPVGAVKLAGLAVVSLGVALASGALAPRRQRL